MLAAAVLLLVGISRDDATTIAVSLAGSVAALILLWAGVTRSSGAPQRDREG